MAHRGRSRTADSADVKKSKGTPRRLTEKIAIMKRREHEQSEAFEKAMRSIFEMQRARIHSGGGSMPSLQSIDSIQPPSIDMQSVYKDLNEVKRHGSSSFKERPHSGGTAGRRVGFERRTNSCDTDPYPTIGLGHTDYYWSAIDGDLSRHKSDSDLQQSLLMQQQASQNPQFTFGSPQHHNRNKLNAPPGDLALWDTKKARAGSMSAALLSPDQYSGPDCSLPVPLGSTGGTSSLPDLTSIEFSSGLDVPLERDDQPPLQKLNPYYCALSKGPGPSKLIYTSFQAQVPMSNPPPNQLNTLMSPPQYSSSTSASYDPFSPFPNIRPSLRQPIPFQQLPPLIGGVRKSPTMPDFRNLHTMNSFPQFKPILPSAYPPPYMPHASPVMRQMPPNAPPPMTIIIQPPPSSSVATTSNCIVPNNHQLPQSQPHGLPPLSMQPPTSTVGPRPQPHGLPPLSMQPPTFTVGPRPQPHAQLHSQQQQHSPSSHHSLPYNGFSGNTSSAPLPPLTFSSSPPKPLNTSGTSLPNTPTITIGTALPSYLEAKQQQALQQKFAAISMIKEPMFRSHSEEDLQRVQKDLMHNPFMGNLANANSVPCVYVESPTLDNPVERSDSPVTGDSPSTSASYASSPPSVSRPYWVDNPPVINEFVFHEWPLEGNVEKNKSGSPPIHHKSLTDLSTIPEMAELSPNNRGGHQLSLPSVVMSDLTFEEQLDKRNSPVFAPDGDFEMDDDGLDSLLRNDVPDLHAFDVNLLGSDSLMSSSPDSFLHNRLTF